MPPTSLTAFDKQALTQFPAIVPQTDLIRYFQLSNRDLQQIARLRGDHNRLGFALQLCTLRYWGSCPEPIQSTPLPVVEYLAHQLGLDPTALHRYGKRAQTRTDHLLAIQQYLGFQSASASHLAHLQDWLLARALEHDKPTLLLELAVQKLYHDKVVRPALSTLEHLVTEVRHRAIQVTFDSLQSILTPSHCQFLDDLLVVDSALAMTPLSWLRRPATVNSPTAIRKTLLKLQFLNTLSIATWDLSWLNPNRLKFLAQLGKKSSNQALQRVAPEKRYAILVAFVYQIRCEIIDEAIDLFIRCLSETYARARHDREAAHLQAEVALNEKVRLLHEFG